ncbi:MAG: hypothetical protein ABIH23_03735 [bacterium]
MSQLAALIALLVNVSAGSSFLPKDATEEVWADPGMHILAKVVSPVTDFNEVSCNSLVRSILSTRELTLPAAKVWLQEYAKRPEKERAPWRQHAAVIALAWGYSEDAGPFCLKQ